LKKEYLALIQSGGGTDPVKPGNLIMSYQRHYVGANFRGISIPRDKQKNYLFGLEEVFLFLD
jgi:hypothetical protein